MGFFRVEKFDSLTDWVRGDAFPFYELGTSDWPRHLSSPGKTKALKVTYDPNSPFFESHFEKVYSAPVHFVRTDFYGKKVSFPELVLSLTADSDATIQIPRPLRPEDFYLSLSIWDGGTRLREWFVPLDTSRNFGSRCFDLQPLIEAGFTKFDRVRIHLLKHGQGLRIYFGDLFLAQDKVEHNLIVALAEMLHLRHKRVISSLAEPATPGRDTVVLDSTLDIYPQLPITIGDPDSDSFELHVVESAPFDDPSTGTVVANFTGEFDTRKVQLAWPAGTPVYEVFPAIYGDLSQSDAVFPVFYISWEAPEPRPNMSVKYSGGTLDSYIRDTVDNNHQVSVRLSDDTCVMAVSIHVYARTLEQATAMWRHLRSIMDDQSFIYVMGTPVDYEVTGYRRLDAEQNVAEALPHYVMELECYPSENVHRREYRSFPALKVLTITQDSLPYAEVVIKPQASEE